MYPVSVRTSFRTPRNLPSSHEKFQGIDIGQLCLGNRCLSDQRQCDFFSFGTLLLLYFFIDLFVAGLTTYPGSDGFFRFGSFRRPSQRRRFRLTRVDTKMGSKRSVSIVYKRFDLTGGRVPIVDF